MLFSCFPPSAGRVIRALCFCGRCHENRSAEAGRVFHEYALQAIKLHETLLRRFAAQEGDSPGHPLRLITGPTISANVLPPLLRGFAEKYPGSPGVPLIRSVAKHFILEDREPVC